MPIYLCQKQNARNITLHEGTLSETVGIMRRDGSFGHVMWRGFIDRPLAKALVGACPVKLEIERYAVGDSISIEWTRVAPRNFVQGCLIYDGVYAVIEKGIPVVV